MKKAIDVVASIDARSALSVGKRARILAVAYRSVTLALILVWLSLTSPLITHAVDEFEPTPAGAREAMGQGKTVEFMNAIANAWEAQEASDWLLAGMSYNEGSWAAWTNALYQKAISFALQAMAMADRAKDARLKSRAIFHLAKANQSLQQYAEADRWIELGMESTLKIAPGSARDIYQGHFHRLRGLQLLHKGQFEQAKDSILLATRLDEAMLADQQVRTNNRPAELAELNNTRHRLLLDLKALADVLEQQNDFAGAIITCERAIRLIEETNLVTTAKSELYLRLGMSLMKQRDFDRALDGLSEALKASVTFDRDDSAYEANNELGNLFLEMDRAADAKFHFRKAIEQIESMRSLLWLPEYRRSYFEKSFNAYEKMIRVGLTEGQLAEAFGFSERARSRMFLDLVGTKVQLSSSSSSFLQEEKELHERILQLQAQLQNRETTLPNTPRDELGVAEKSYNALLDRIRRENREQASLMAVEPLSLSQVQALLEPGQALLEYFVTQQQVYLWAVDKERLNSFSGRLSRADLAKKLEALRAAISERKPLKEYQKLARELYEQLVAPAEPFLHGKELIIVPHDVLHNLPFHALVGSDGRYLIEKYSIQYISSASLMQFTQAKRRELGKKVLAFGNPEGNDSFPELQFAERETAELKRSFPETTQLLKSEATKRKVKELAPRYDILHFAAHTELKQDDPLSSAVLLAKSNTDNGRLEVRDIFGLNIKASLVVLSGCETGLGKLSKGDELVGLTRAFIYAGTPSVIASLWKVDDASTAQLMSSFYRNLKTKTKVASLRRAQLDMISGKANSELLAQRGVGGVAKLGQTPLARYSNAMSTSHPYFWAPFILVGDGK